MLKIMFPQMQACTKRGPELKLIWIMKIFGVELSKFYKQLQSAGDIFVPALLAGIFLSIFQEFIGSSSNLASHIIRHLSIAFIHSHTRSDVGMPFLIMNS